MNERKSSIRSMNLPDNQVYDSNGNPVFSPKNRQSLLSGVARQTSNFSEGLAGDVIGLLAEMSKKIDMITDNPGGSARDPTGRSGDAAALSIQSAG